LASYSELDLIAPDGTRLCVRRWAPAGPRGTILIVHGLGEHIGRYDSVAAWLAARGFSVVGHDLRGHGRSGGPRGGVRHADDPLTDLSAVVEAVRTSDRPLVLLGHSMGGAFAARFVVEARQPVDALVLSSPALDGGLSAFQKLQLALGHALAPSLAVNNGLDPTGISRDAAVVRAYVDDPLVHDRVTARLGRAILDAGALAIDHARAWRVPTLLLYAGADRLVSPRGSDRFAAAAPTDVVASERFDALFHEILNEGAAAAPVYAHLERWLDAHVPRRS
jgi:alpha-beta hydrolase superfamily lysophospholipase